jgi:hypothetical protein
MNDGNIPTEDELSAVLKPLSWGDGCRLYLQRKPDSEIEVNIVSDIICCPNPVENKLRRSPEPKIDADLKIYLKERPGIIDSLLSRKRYWISRWKRRIRT